MRQLLPAFRQVGVEMRGVLGIAPMRALLQALRLGQHQIGAFDQPRDMLGQELRQIDARFARVRHGALAIVPGAVGDQREEQREEQDRQEKNQPRRAGPGRRRRLVSRYRGKQRGGRQRRNSSAF